MARYCSPAKAGHKKQSPGSLPGLLVSTLTIRRLKGRLPDVLVQGLGDSVLGTVADQLFDHLAALEHQQRGDAGHFIAHGSGAVGVHVHLANLDLALKLGGEFFHDGRDGAAGAAPGCPEVHQHGLIRFQNILVEVRICYFDDSITSHFHSPRCSVAPSAYAPCFGKQRAALPGPAITVSAAPGAANSLFYHLTFDDGEPEKVAKRWPAGLSAQPSTPPVKHVAGSRFGNQNENLTANCISLGEAALTTWPNVDSQASEKVSRQDPVTLPSTADGPKNWA